MKKLLLLSLMPFICFGMKPRSGVPQGRRTIGMPTVVPNLDEGVMESEIREPMQPIPVPGAQPQKGEWRPIQPAKLDPKDRIIQERDQLDTIIRNLENIKNKTKVQVQQLDNEKKRVMVIDRQLEGKK